MKTKKYPTYAAVLKNKYTGERYGCSKMVETPEGNYSVDAFTEDITDTDYIIVQDMLDRQLVMLRIPDEYEVEYKFKIFE